jgi:Tfp pilus assembly protein PilF
VSKTAAAFAVIDSDPDQAHAIANDAIRDDPDDLAALFIIGTINARAERFGVALAAFERITRLDSRRHQAWNNAGMALQECGQPQRAREYFKRAYELAPQSNYMANIGAAYLCEGNYTEAIRWCKKAIEKDNDTGAWTTLGFAQLATGNWAEGWKGYEHCLGGRFRKEVKIGDEPKWDGSPVENLFIYGEQGLGDEIMYASIIPDAAKHAKRITLECDKRLAGLFKRSFPEIEVRGTRREEKPWASGRTFDAGVGSGSLASIFRTSRTDCPRRPYLVADPERRLQWRALFDSWQRPVVGIAWTGGRAATQRKERLVGLEAFRPLIEVNPDKVFVSLQYTDASEEIAETGLPVKHIPRAVQSPDYDDTAAFVAELDYIIGPPTTIHHIAGALGKPSTILVPSRPMWDCAYGDDWPWYQKQVFFRQRKGESWADCLKRFTHAEGFYWV